ncbi:MAG TPA: nucleotide exchange factor GrpE [Drouetiella sp.]|jgi:molecular chaperone GrpE
MATDDSGTPNGGTGAPEPEAEKPEDRANRMNAAKAFYRAMYAGEEVAPDDFGINGAPTAAPATAPAHSGPCPNCARLEAQAAEFEKQKNEAENFYKRIAADFENYRRRNDRERDEAQGLGIQKAIEQILPALDDMDRAKTSLANVQDPKAILDSLNLVFTRFAKCLENTGVKQMDVIGEPFDPRLHEPVQEVETNEFADGAVVHELRRGYMYKDKVLRPALVNVASNPSGVIVKKEPAPAAAEAAPEATAEAAPAAPAPAPEAPAPAPEAPAPEAEVSAQAPEAPAPAPEAATPEAKAPEPAAAAPEPAAAAPAESAAPEAPAAEPAQPTAPAEPPPKKAIDKLKPTRVHTETQDLPVFKIEDYAESLAPEPELEIVDTEPVKEAATGTVYDITDVDIEEKPAGQEEPVGE